MKKPIPVTKIVHHLSDDNSVELYTLCRGEVAETYLRRGGSTELVEGEVSLKYNPELPTHNINLRDLTRLDWSTKGGLQVRKTPKNL